MDNMNRDLLAMSAGGQPMTNTGMEGFGADPELMQQLKQMIAQADPQELQALMQMPPEQLVQMFIEQAGLEPEEAQEAVQILQMMLGTSGGQQQPPPPQQAPPVAQGMPQGG